MQTLKVNLNVLLRLAAFLVSRLTRYESLRSPDHAPCVWVILDPADDVNIHRHAFKRSSFFKELFKDSGSSETIFTCCCWSIFHKQSVGSETMCVLSFQRGRVWSGTDVQIPNITCEFFLKVLQLSCRHSRQTQSPPCDLIRSVISQIVLTSVCPVCRLLHNVAVVFALRQQHYATGIVTLLPSAAGFARTLWCVWRLWFPPAGCELLIMCAGNFLTNTKPTTLVQN